PCVDLPTLHSFPTRRSSDLGGVDDRAQAHQGVRGAAQGAVLTRGVGDGGSPLLWGQVLGGPAGDGELRMPGGVPAGDPVAVLESDRKSTRLNSSHVSISYAV